MMSLSACGGVELVPRAKAPEAPSQGLSKCAVAASRNSPLVTEWPASEKANLEVRLREGAVAVAYSGCEMRLVPECRLGGGYQWLRTSVASDIIEIGNEDELYAKLPLGAVSLEGELRSTGRLAMQTTVTGQVRLASSAMPTAPPSPSCAQATHVLSSMTIGAFKLRSGGTLKGGAGVDSPVGGARVGTESMERLLREAGRPDQCAASTDQAPHADCRSPIQMFLSPLPWAAKPAVASGHKRVAFSSADGDVRWEVHAGGTPLCTTPCTRDVPEASAFVMRTDKSSGAGFWPEVALPPLSDVTPASDVEVRAHPSSNGLVIPGIVFTALSGCAIAAGIPLTAVGFASDQGGMAAAGLITGGVGLAALVGSLVMIAAGRSHPEVVERAGRRPSADGVGFGPRGLEVWF
jgi:hypothetical protein